MFVEETVVGSGEVLDLCPAHAICLMLDIVANSKDFEGMSLAAYHRRFARVVPKYLPKAHGFIPPGV